MIKPYVKILVLNVGNGWVAGGCWDLQKSNESPLRGRHPKITFRPGDDDKQNNYALKNEV
jgi:hypothetical protein